MAEHFFMSITIIVMVLVSPILEAYGNKINHMPKMKDRNEEREFSITIGKTREIFSVIKR